MEFDLEKSIAVLQRTPHVLRSMLSGLPGDWIHSNYGPDTFSPYDVVGHLIHGDEGDWMERARIILRHGPTRTFDGFDRYAQFEASGGRPLAELLDEFAQLRARNLEALRALGISPTDLAKTGKHPTLGEVTLSQLLATWVAHDLNHIAQIAKCMATQYESAVGPWRSFLGVLRAPVTAMDADGAQRRKAVERQWQGEDS